MHYREASMIFAELAILVNLCEIAEIVWIVWNTKIEFMFLTKKYKLLLGKIIIHLMSYSWIIYELTNKQLIRAKVIQIIIYLCVVDCIFIFKYT